MKIQVGINNKGDRIKRSQTQNLFTSQCYIQTDNCSEVLQDTRSALSSTLPKSLLQDTKEHHLLLIQPPASISELAINLINKVKS